MLIMEFSNSLSVEKKLLQVKISEKEGGEKWIQNQEKNTWNDTGKFSCKFVVNFRNFRRNPFQKIQFFVRLAGFHKNPYFRNITIFNCNFHWKKIGFKASKKQARHYWNNFVWFSMYFVQYTYFRTIELSNVSFATILQFTAPFFIFIYESVKNKKIPAISTLLLLFMTVLGVVFIATQKEKFQVYLSFQKHCLLDFFQQLWLPFTQFIQKNYWKDMAA